MAVAAAVVYHADGPLLSVLYYHGGPHNTVALGFNEQLHVLAGARFAVVAVNFRGSTGFGAAFADSILRDWVRASWRMGLPSWTVWWRRELSIRIGSVCSVAVMAGS
ncbi:MAG: hypothetical protein E6I52_25235 [Chloroflexi bacterium]|nr:MAG: hypothetical protein E6I52_25235 [Chloroflexota bacterium]